ncbi:alpha/beta hydrolase [Microbispora cellulosiformans]|uniref:Alpha/beta hydrolase n=1 Tax=Microbispora cellulosiformans TaxID=2614688 RepID=A0A5J5K987_9ACTN|nr:alpha/beta hydrolase [Microbispora cellulosiformans]KAA9381550.1 alpha/beta hydrolase [Microbispora cellulosiformans]
MTEQQVPEQQVSGDDVPGHIAPVDITSVNVVSADGTTLAVDAIGQGAPVILVGGAFNDRSTVAALAAELAPAFTVLTYDRRGRGASDDRSEDYQVANEVADLAAVIEHAGGRASAFGHSSGAVLVLEAARRGLPIDRVAVYEPPYHADENQPRLAAEVYDRLRALVAAGDRDGAAELFLREAVGVPAEAIAGMKAGEGWAFMADKAPSLPYDVLVTAPWQGTAQERVAGIGVPVLAVYGDRTSPGLAKATEAVAAALPGAELRVMPGEDHAVLRRPAALARILTDFFA